MAFFKNLTKKLGRSRKSNAGQEVKEPAEAEAGMVDLEALYEDAISEIGARLEYLKACDDFSTTEAYDAIDYIRSSCRLLVNNEDIKKLCSRIVDFMMKQGLAPLVVKIFRLLIHYNSKQAFNSRRKIGLAAHCLTYQIEKTVAERVKVELVKCGIVRVLLTDLDSCDPNTNDSTQRIRVFDDLYDLHNFVKTKDVIPVYLTANAVNILMKFAQADNVMTKINSLLVLAHIVNEKESKVLATTEGCISTMVEMLQAAAQSEERTHSFSIKEVEGEENDENEIPYTTSLLTITKGFENLASSDANKEAIVQHGGIPALTSILRHEYTEEEQHTAAEALWKLSFLESNLDVILTHLTYTDMTALQVLKEMQVSESPKLRDASKGLLHQLGLVDIHEELPVEHPRDPPPSYQETMGAPHVMISYRWDQQEKVIKVRDKLRDKGYNVWMDIDKLEGNILVAMANAVEQADAILVCVSRSYKASVHCQTEAHYAYQQQKLIIPVMVEEGYIPDGWLGALTAMKKYIRAFSDEVLEQDMPGLVRELGNRGRVV